MIAIYPGSFDPITLGHLDIIERGCTLFDQVIVAVLCNPAKQPMFAVEKRIEQIQRCTQHLSNVEVDSFMGLTVEYAKIRKAGVLLRGLRVLSDFEKELQMAHTNQTLMQSIETVFLATSNEYSFLSSSVVKEIAKFGGRVDHLVPENVAQEIYQCYEKKTTAVTQNAMPTADNAPMMPPNPKPNRAQETSTSNKNSTDSKK